MRPYTGWLLAIVILFAQTTCRADNPAEVLLNQVAHRVHGIQSLSGEIADTYTVKHLNTIGQQVKLTTFTVRRPNYAHSETWISGMSVRTGKTLPRQLEEVGNSDGANTVTYFVRQKAYAKHAVDRSGANIAGNYPDDFFNDTTTSYLAQVIDARKHHHLTDLKLDPPATWEGRRYHVVEYTINDTYAGEKHRSHMQLYIGSDRLVHRTIEDFSYGSEPGREEYAFRRLIINPPAPHSLFAYNPPHGAVLLSNRQQPVLANGKDAPDFQVKDRSGKPIKLSDYGGKVVLIDFWATWCGPCQQSLPHTNKVAAQYASKGVRALAVNVWDDQDSFHAWLPDHKQYGALTFAIDTTDTPNDVASKKYLVSGIPTQFVIGKDGKVAWSAVGYDGPSNDLAKALQGARGVHRYCRG